MNRMTVVYHMAIRSDDKVVVSRVMRVCEDGVVVSTMTHSVTLSPGEAKEMAKAMRDTNFGRFFKEDDFDSVEVWCEAYEGYGVIWKRKDGAEVCEDICCLESGGDGWSWEFARELEDAAHEAEEGSE